MTGHTQPQYGLRPEAERFPMMVVLSFVYVCNAGCPNCPYNNSDIRKQYGDALYMPDELFKKIADEFLKSSAASKLNKNELKGVLDSDDAQKVKDILDNSGVDLMSAVKKGNVDSLKGTLSTILKTEEGMR